MMAPSQAPPTVLAIKQSYLSSQTRRLSQPLPGPSRVWRSSRNNDGDEAADLPERAVEDALVRLNHALQQHARRVYAPQATRHVAEQIDQLYWNAGERAVPGAEGQGGGDDDDAAAGLLSVGADLADPSTITALPPTWQPEREAEAHPMEARRYAELAARLQSLDARRQAAEARVRRLRRMRDVLAPFRPEENGNGEEKEEEEVVQANLVTRDGEVERELERMRILLARVGDRVARLPNRDGDGAGLLFGEEELGGGGGDSMVGVEQDERRKIEEIVGMM